MMVKNRKQEKRKMGKEDSCDDEEQEEVEKEVKEREKRREREGEREKSKVEKMKTNLYLRFVRREKVAAKTR